MTAATSADAPPLALLGPQRDAPVVRDVLADLALPDDGRPLAVVTAGWEEREGEDEVLAAHLGRPMVNLSLWSRAERAFTEDPDLFAALRRRHDRMRRLRRLYRRRLHHAAEALREVLFPASVTHEDEFRVLEILDSGEDELLAEVARDALEHVLHLDAQHLDQVRGLQQAFAEKWHPRDRLALGREHGSVAEAIEGSAAVLVAGGHVAVLLNRLRLFGLGELIGSRPVIAWAAGAMALTERVVLFHDSPPQGASLPEVFEPGLGLARDVVVFPGAATRLELDDPVRVTGLVRRMAPARCLPLDRGEVAWRAPEGWHAPRALHVDGSVGVHA